MKHGEWGQWLCLYCEFSHSTANRYMKAADQNPHALPISAVRHLYDSGKPGAKKPQERGPAEEKPAVSAPPDPVWDPPPAVSVVVTPAPVEPEPAPPVVEWEDDEADLLARTEAEITESIDKVMASDDRLAAAYEEIKRQAAEIAALKISRDGLQNRCGELVRMLKKEQAAVARLRSVK